MKKILISLCLLLITTACQGQPFEHTKRLGVGEVDGTDLNYPYRLLFDKGVVSSSAGVASVSITTLQGAATGSVLTLNSNGVMLWQPITSSAGGYDTIKDEGSAQAQRTTMDFVGAGVTASDVGGETRISIPGGGNSVSGGVLFVFDGAGSAITTNSTVWIKIPFACTLTEWEAASLATGSIVADIKRTTYTGVPIIGGKSIAGTEKPTLANQQRNRDQALSTWTTSINAGDYIQATVESTSIVTYSTVALSWTRTL